MMDKTKHIRLLSTASVDNTSKFAHVDDHDKRPKMCGWPPKHVNPLPHKEKELHETLHQN